MMDNSSKEYKEVVELLKYLPKEKVDKIPQDIIELFESKQDLEYEYKVDETKDFDEQVMLDETKAIFANIFKEYWANDEQREIIDKIQENENNILQQQKEANEINVCNNLEEKTELIKDKEETSNNISKERTQFNKCTQIMIVKKENLFTKIVKFLKELFGKGMFFRGLNLNNKKT